jgi:hypothetical protein
MAIIQNDPEIAQKEHKAGNIYLDAALEALRQAKKEDSGLSYLVLIHDEKKHGIEMNGSISALAHSLSSFAKDRKDVTKLINIASYDLKMERIKRDNILDILDRSEELLDKWIEELEIKKKGNKRDIQ